MNFSYRAVNPSGEIITGTKEANSKNDLIVNLKKENITLISAAEIASKGVGTKSNKGEATSWAEKDIFPQKIKSTDYAVMCRQAYTMLNAGMNIISTLQILSVQIENKRLRETVGYVVIELKKGYPLSTCLKLYPKVFPPLFINMVESGELTGNLDKVLDSLGVYYERESEINRKIKKATLYPTILCIVVVLVVLLLMIFVVPVFMEMFTNSGQELPAPTLALIAISEFCVSYWYVIIGAIVAMAALFAQIKKHKKSKKVYDKFVNKIPGVGSSVMKIATARFSRTAGTLLNSGIPVVQAIKSAAQVSENRIVIDGVDAIADDIRSGQTLSTMLASIGFFPPMMISMINIGEESGDVVGLLNKTADYYEQEMEAAIDTMTGIIEPVMIIVLSIVVGFVVIAILLPVLDMATTVA